MKTALRRGCITLASVLLVLGGLAVGLWFWSGSASSLATLALQLQRLLPAGHSLEVRAVTGSLREGGHIGWLRWQHGGLQVQAQDLQWRWQPAALLQGQLLVNQLHVKQLRIDNEDAASAEPTAAPSSLALPLRVEAHVSVDRVQWQSADNPALEQVTFSYVFDSYLHNIYAGSAQFSSNNYGFTGQLQATSPMALAVQAQGLVNTPVPGRAPLKVASQVSLSGTLAGDQARLTLQAALTPQAAPGATPPAGAMQASLSAQLAPWQTQKIISAQGQWQALNLAALWAQAPQTQLQGQATVRPDGSGWQASLQLGNTLSGPWNQHRLPVQDLQAQLAYRQGQWWLQSLQASGADGHLQASGSVVNTNTVSWQGQAVVQGINPAAIDTRLAPDRVSGTVSAHHNPQTSGIDFDVLLQSETRRLPAGAALPLHRLAAQGRWAAPQLTLQNLQVQAHEAQLQGQFSLHTGTLATQAQLSLGLPGLQATLNGQLAPSQGQGSLQLQVQDAAQASRWLAHWPQTAHLLSGGQLHGALNVNAQWQGGWQHEAQALQLQARLDAPQLQWSPQTASQPSGSLRQVQLALTGTPHHFSLSGQGQALLARQQLDWQTRTSASQTTAGLWQAGIEQLQLAWHPDRDQAPWRLQLLAPGTTAAAPLTVNWQAGQRPALTVSPGVARLQGPLPGQASLSWQTLQWSPASTTPQPAHTAAHWQGQGQVEGLPLAWLDAFSNKSMADLGLGSDLLLSGRWQAAQTDSLHLSATLERSSGDLRLHTRDQVLPAKLRDAWMQVNLDAGQLAASLRWDSEHAGKALLALSTQLTPQASGWTWPAQAPVAGSLQLQLPPVDAWSALAPPGWRLRGTVDAHINLSGTQALPQWDGHLRARDLALRSVVDGIDFSRGSLDARLHDQQLDIQSFTLQGGDSPDGGQLGLSGSVFWLPGGSAANWRERFQMALQAQISALRVSARPDRRLVVSGQLSANLKQSTLMLRGALSANQALITLPDDNAPTLGQDVLVRQPGRPPTHTSAPGTPTSPPAGVRPDVLIDLDLGPDFRLRGRGLETRLAGKLSLAAKGRDTPTLHGSLRTVNGTYQAYGQRLLIERGVLRFSGPIDNPALTILALRPQLSQRVGVQVSGTALSPIVRLYAEPDLPDAEKLAWLVLGRSASSGGAEAALMQQAALALLGGNGKSLSDSLSQALGLDELSFRGASASDNNGNASAASVTLGKRLSKDFYVAYESSLSGAMGVLSIFYDLSRRLTLRAQTGEQSAVDLIYTLRYD